MMVAVSTALDLTEPLGLLVKERARPEEISAGCGLWRHDKQSGVQLTKPHEMPLFGVVRGQVAASLSTPRGWDTRARALEWDGLGDPMEPTRRSSRRRCRTTARLHTRPRYGGLTRREGRVPLGESAVAAALCMPCPAVPVVSRHEGPPFRLWWDSRQSASLACPRARRVGVDSGR